MTAVKVWRVLSATVALLTLLIHRSVAEDGLAGGTRRSLRDLGTTAYSRVEDEEEPCTYYERDGKTIRRCKKFKKVYKVVPVDDSDGEQQQNATVGALHLNILHFNDWHVRVEPNSDTQHVLCDDYKNEQGHCSGGIARMKTYIDAQRAMHPNILVLNAGDDNKGTVWDRKYGCQAPAHFMNMLKADAMTVGNHEFDDGADELATYLELLETQVLGCNLQANGHRLGGLVKPYIVKQVNNTKVCIFGLITTDTSPSKTYPTNLAYPYDAGKECVKTMKNDGCKIIILLSHLGYTADIYAAKVIPDIDVIIGGHSHSFLWNISQTTPSYDMQGGYAQSDHVWGPYPTWVYSDVQGGNQVPVYQAGWGSRYIGNIKLSFDEDGRLIQTQGVPVLLGGPKSSHPVEEDAATKAEIKKWKYW